MKSIPILVGFLFVLMSADIFAQQEKTITEVYRTEMESMKSLLTEPKTITNDTNIDIRFYHLRLKPAIDSAWIEGHVSIHFTSKIPELNQLMLDLQRSLTVDSISGAGSFFQQGDSLIIVPNKSLKKDSTAVIEIFYKGNTGLAGNLKGLRYSSHGNNEPVLVTLSTPYLAHYWFPCKDGPSDKADSVYIDITVPIRYYNNIPLKAVSNGLLIQVEESLTEKTFQWKHRYPVVSYYVMMAISNYVLLEDEYCNDEYCFPLEYYVFAEDSAEARIGVSDLPEMMALFESLFGPYPFRNEKYGMTQLGFYGAIENQTNSVINKMSPDWKMVVVHELAHMWFGCQITCSDWHHGWLNEGFATYCEALWKEHKQGPVAYRAHMASKGWYQGGTVHLENIDDPFNIFIAIIYNKGAWVLHMLRSLMGDEVFFEFLRSYASLPELAFSHVSTERFRELAEEAYGADLEYFFSQWVYDAYFPAYYYNFEQNEGLFNLQLYQMQGELGRRPLFTTPLDIQFSFNDFSDTIVRVFNDSQNQIFSFDFGKTVTSIDFDPNQWLLHSATYNPELPVGIPRLNRSDRYSLYPNPTSGSMMLQLESNVELPVTLVINNAKGIEIKRIQIRQPSQLIDLRGANKGIYIISIENRQGMVARSKKIILN
jgi:aminopeptidase N